MVMLSLRANACAILIALLGVSGNAGAQTANQDQLQTLCKEGALALQAGQTARAEGLFQQATQMAPDFAPAWLDLGLTQLQQGKLPQAIASMHKAVELDPAAHGGHLFLGIAEYQSNRTDDAIGDLQKAIEQDPKDVQALTWLGIVELNAGHAEKATEPLDRAAELAPGDENVLDYRVQAHMAVAKQSYTQLFHADPTSWRLHRLNAVIDAQAQNHHAAVTEYELAIQQAPREPELYEGLGWEYRALGQADKAAEAFAQQLKLTPDNPIAMYNLGSAEVESGQIKPGAELLEKVIKVYQTPTAADYYLGLAWTAEGNYTEAAKEFERATQLEGELRMRAWYELSQAYRHMGQTEQARAAVAKYQELKQSAASAAQQADDWRRLDAGGAASAPGTSPP